MGWRLLVLPEDEPADFALKADGSIEVASNASAAFLYREVEGAGDILTWSWRIDHPGPVADPTARGADDRPLAVHLWFPEEEDSRSLQKAFAGLFGYPVFGRIVTYIWATDESQGKRFENPYLDDEGLVIVLRDRRDPIGLWVEERIDFAADFERHFGQAAPEPRYIAISGDSDDLGGMTLGRIHGLSLAAAESR